MCGCRPITHLVCCFVEKAQRQAQEASQAQARAAEEEAKASKLADQAEQRAVSEQGSGNLAAAVAASSAAAKYALWSSACTADICHTITSSSVKAWCLAVNCALCS